MKFRRVTKLVFAFILALSVVLPASADLLGEKTEELSKLRDQIEAQQKQLDSIRKRKTTLQNQLDILDGQVKLSELQLQALSGQIDTVNLNMSQINGDLVSAEVEIYEKKRVLREAIKEAYVRNRSGLLEVMMGSSDLSDFISQIEYITTIEGRITNSISVLQTLNDELTSKKGELEAADKQLKELQSSKQLEQNNLNAQVQGKASLLQDAKLTEAEYQNKLESAVIEQQKLENQIAALAKSSRRGVLNEGKYSLLWPIPSRLVTATFRDGDYQSRFKLVHNAIDIATPQGTPIKAPADAYVLKVKFDGSNAYSYIMLDHGNGMVTVYGHVSGVSVATGQFVPVGMVIGSTGGTPMTTGAGWLTTGPHLHFEVWLNGEARNPLAYLAG
ncbi:MAG: peptidoglycan DD-metalloendopeptidase family protein [Patescibacteria group bacterium]|jgi:murein DD-endopeptidase MepM/ murein hydrolase activator NlpD